ncbi:hypothetical protein [Agromyces bauzanensis]|uniref:hypothetical protein n=1 Tax=Agromyces bauzanensis TaxID=1308924 RepID=UPI00166D6F46|nr:hypothetical protein [Agromyces bauzanensis]
MTARQALVVVSPATSVLGPLLVIDRSEARRPRRSAARTRTGERPEGMSQAT